MDPPSSELVRTLTDLGLASSRDLRRAAGRVRRLGRGLPAYDSLWIDALVRLGRITPLQGRKLELRRGMELRVGPRWLLESARHLDARMPLYSARDVETRERFLVLQHALDAREAEAFGGRFQQFLRAIEPVRDRLACVPTAWHHQDGLCSILSPDVPGQTLSRLLVRRGRFPESAVRAIGRELAWELSQAESVTAHGDLRPANVLLAETGRISLMNWGALSAWVPAVTIHTPLPEEAYDGVAPERLELGVPVSTVTDVYALGCLLWHLLAGRPPFTLADPLARLTACRKRQVPDVRTQAPETSETLALLIRRMTFREPHRRPQSFREILVGLEMPQRESRRRLRQFARAFESAAPRAPRSRPPRRWRILPNAAVASAVTAALLLLAWNRSHLGLPDLPILGAAVISDEKRETGTRGDKETAKPDIEQDLLPLPAADLAGVVRLLSGRSYRAGEISVRGPLTLISDPEKPATIAIVENPLVLQAERVTLQYVRVIRRDTERVRENEHPGIRVRTQELVIRRSDLLDASATSGSPLIDWEVENRSDPRAGRLLVSETRLDGRAAVVCLRAPLTAALFENVYRQGSGTLLDLPAGVRSGLKVPVVLRNCTFRESGPLVRFPDLPGLPRSGRLSIQGGATLLGLRDGDGLVELSGSRVPPGWEQHIEVSADGLIARPDLAAVMHRQLGVAPAGRLEAEMLTIDGLLTGEFRFESDDLTSEPWAGVVIDALPIRGSTETPGADLSRLLPLGE